MTTRINNTNIGTLSEFSVSGLLELQQSSELIQTKSSATGTVEHDYTAGAIVWHTSPSANFTVNVTNLPNTSERANVLTLFVVQGATPYMPTALQIDGTAKTINWLSGTTPSGNADKTNLITFYLINISSTYYVFGQTSYYG
jgi:hypothetical protein